MISADLIATHLNTSVGSILTAKDIIQSLEAGHLCASSDQSNALICSIFTEMEPRLILQCATENNISVSQANNLYLDTLKNNAPQKRHLGIIYGVFALTTASDISSHKKKEKLRRRMNLYRSVGKLTILSVESPT